MTGSASGFNAEWVPPLMACGATIVPSARLAAYTTFRLGGPCRALIDCTSRGMLKECAAILRRHGVRPLLIGGGSNLLVSDRGIDEVVVRFVDARPDIRVEGTSVHVSAGVALDDLARVAVEHGLDGLVSCSGIPGTVGGALAGNAGAFGEQIGDVVVSLEVMLPDGRLVEFSRDACGFAYRHSAIPASGAWICSARLDLRNGDREVMLRRRSEILALRASKHPDWRVIPTAGSFFKNIEPTSRAERRQAAGWFLEQAGALAMREGGAHLFSRHANIIVADADCRASDVWTLSQRMADAVKERFGLDLQREVKLIGSFP